MARRPNRSNRPPGERQRAVFSWTDKLDVLNILRDKAEWVLEHRPTTVELAREVSKWLEYDPPMSPNTLQEILEVWEVKWEPRFVTGAKAASLWKVAVKEVQEDMQTLSSRLENALASLNAARTHWGQEKAAMQAQIDTLRGLVHHLYNELGQAAPAGYIVPPEATDKKSILGNSK